MSRRPTTHELEALIAAHAAELAALKAENEKLAQRVLHLEEQLRLERLRRYAPKSEKLKERIFPVGRSKSPGYGHLKLPHLMIAVSAAEQQ